jgi:hypothetical protein
MSPVRAVISAIVCDGVATTGLDKLAGTSVAWSMLIALPISALVLLWLLSPTAVEPSWSAVPVARTPAAELQASVLASRLDDAFTDQARFRGRIQPRLAALALGTLRQRPELADLTDLSDRRARDALGAALHTLLTDPTAALPEPTTLRRLLDRLMEEA